MIFAGLQRFRIRWIRLASMEGGYSYTRCHHVVGLPLNIEWRDVQAHKIEVGPNGGCLIPSENAKV